MIWGLGLSLSSERLTWQCSVCLEKNTTKINIHADVDTGHTAAFFTLAFVLCQLLEVMHMALDGALVLEDDRATPPEDPFRADHP